MDALEIHYWFIAAFVCCILWVWFSFKGPAGVAFLSLTALPLHLETFFDFGPLKSRYYVWLTPMLEAVTVALLFKRAIDSRQLGKLYTLLCKREALFLWSLVLIWIKVAFDCVLRDMTNYQLYALKSAVSLIFLPIGIVILSFIVYPRERVIVDLIKGLCGFSFAVAAPALVAAALDGRILEAGKGGLRLLLYGHSTVETGTQLLTAYVGCIAAAALPNTKVPRRLLLVSWLFGLGLAIALNGTRQAAGSALLATTSLFVLYRKERQIQVLLGCFVVALGVFVAKGMFAETSLAQRTRADVVLSDGRFDYWRESLDQVRENPLIGIGFRNSGHLEDVIDPATRKIVEVRRDNAHGLFQEVLTEHGVLLGLILLMSFLIVVMCSLFAPEVPPLHRHFYFCLLAACAAGFFSGGLCSAFYFYVVAVLAPGMLMTSGAPAPPTYVRKNRPGKTTVSYLPVKKRFVRPARLIQSCVRRPPTTGLVIRTPSIRSTAR